MANASDYFSGKYATASQLPTERHLTAVITGVTEESMQQTKDTKLVLHLRNVAGKPWPKGVVLNVTNGKALIAAYGENTDDWTGRQIEIWAATTSFAGKPTMGIRLMAVGNGHSSTPMPPSVAEESSQRAAINAAVPLANREPGAGGGDLDDSIPWSPSVQ